MNCDEYLSRLATRSVEELAQDRAQGHASACAQCERVTDIVVARERDMLVAYSASSSAIPALFTADAALATARRRATGRKYEIGLSIALAVAALFMAQSLVVPRLFPTAANAEPLTTETFRLQCLSQEQALDLVTRSRLSKNASISWGREFQLNVIKISAPRDELAKLGAMLDRYDNAPETQCAATKPRAIVP